MTTANVTASSQSAQAAIYIRNKADCAEIDTGKGEKIYELFGVVNQTGEKHSVAIVEIAQNGSSQPHFHEEAQEGYFLLEGSGTLTIDGYSRKITKGDLAHIRSGTVHTVSNEEKATLIFLCICAPAWVPTCFKEKEQPQLPSADQSLGEDKFCIKKVENPQSSQQLHHLLERSDSTKYGVDVVFVKPGEKTSPEQNQGGERTVYVVDGTASIIIDGLSHTIRKGELAKIPSEKTDQITNIGNDLLQLVRVSA